MSNPAGRQPGDPAINFQEKIVKHDWDVRAFDILHDNGLLTTSAEIQAEFEALDMIDQNTRAKQAYDNLQALRKRQEDAHNKAMQARYPGLLPPTSDIEDPFLWGWDGTT